MKVFKFGGASVKDSAGVKNLSKIVSEAFKLTSLFVVVSAMGKTTNALENLLKKAWQKQDFQKDWKQLEAFHLDIAADLGIEDNEIRNLLFELEETLRKLPNGLLYDQAYDQIVAYGELLSTKIIATYLQSLDLPCIWHDARHFIHTDHTWRDGQVQWQITQQVIQQNLEKNNQTIGLTQGFIASNLEGQGITLGREGSDFTGAIFAHCLDAESLTIWKDVPGVLNADPRKVENTTLYRQISYREAAEMSKYGASVIHPKTIAPLAKKGIPLYVRSFIDTEAQGTQIANFSEALSPLAPAIIFKENQVLIELEAKEFNFLTESDLALICNIISELNLPLNLLHKSATKCQVCANNWESKVTQLQERLDTYFDITIRPNLRLISIKHATSEKRHELLGGHKIILSEESPEVYQYIVANQEKTISIKY